MSEHTPSTLTKNLVIYRPKAGKSDQLLGIVKQHAPALRASGLITDEPVKLYKATDLRRGGGEPEPYFVETFEWTHAGAPGIAHQLPEIMAVWETMSSAMDDDGLTITMLEPIS